MRKKSTFLNLLVGMLAFSLLWSCAKDYDEDISRINDRLNSLEELTTKINGEIQLMDAAVKAIQGYDHVVSVETLTDGTGYAITFAKSGKITIKNGKDGSNGKDAPIIGIKADTDGIYYWTKTTNGVTEWLMADGKKMPVSAAPAPTMGVDKDGYWTIDIHDGKGAVRMKDANGNEVKASGMVNGSNVTYEVINGGKDIKITVGGNSFVVPYRKAGTLKFTDGMEMLYIGYGVGAGNIPTMKLTLDLPADLTYADYQSLYVNIDGKAGSSSDVSTRAVATGWNVTITKQPKFKEDGTLDTSVKAEISISSPLSGTSLTESERNAIITVKLVYTNNNEQTVTRTIKVTEIDTQTWSLAAFTMANPTKTPSNVLVDVTASVATNATFTIPSGITKAEVPVVTLRVATGMKFEGTLTINAPSYDGIVVLEAQTPANAIAGEITINIPNGSFTIESGTTGDVKVATKPGTFTVGKSAITGGITVNAGSLVVNGTAASITTTIVEPIVISGSVTGTITVEAPSGNNEVPATPITVTPEATNVGSISAPKSEVVIEPSEGSTTTTIGKITAEKAVIGTGVTTGGVTVKNLEVEQGGKTGNVVINDGGSITVEKGAETGTVDATNANPDNIIIGGTTGTVTPPTVPSPTPFTVGTTSYETLDEAFAAVTATNNVILVKSGNYAGFEITGILSRDFAVVLQGNTPDVALTKAVITVSANSHLTITNLRVDKVENNGILTIGENVKIDVTKNGGNTSTLRFIASTFDNYAQSLLSIEGTPTYLWGAKDAATLISILKNTDSKNNGIILLNDIVTNRVHIKSKDGYLIDGNGKNLIGVITTAGDGGHYNILDIDASKNIIIKNLTIAQNGGKNSNGVTIQNSSDKITFDDVAIKNCGKAAIVVGRGSKNVLFKNSSTSGNAWGGVNVDPGTDLSNTVRFTIENSTFAETTKIWADKVSGVDEATVKNWVNAPGWNSGYFVSDNGAMQYKWSPTAIPTPAIITNTSTNEVYTTIKEAVKEAKANETITLTEGEYPLTIAANEDGKVTDNNDWYCKIEADNLTIKGLGDKNKIIVYGKTFTLNGPLSSQDLISVQANNVTIENLTLMPKVETNKAIYVESGKTFTLKNCIVTPNTKVTSSVVTAGSIYADNNSTITLEGNKLEYCRVRCGTDVTATVKGNSFKGGQRFIDESKIGQWPAIETVGAVSSNTAVVVNNNTFTECWLMEADGISVIKASTGTITLSENIFPDNKTYWYAVNNGNIYVNDNLLNYNYKVDRYSLKSFSLGVDQMATMVTSSIKNPTDPEYHSWQGIQAQAKTVLSNNWNVETELHIVPNIGIDKMRTSVWVNIYDKNNTDKEFWVILGYKKDGNTQTLEIFDETKTANVITGEKWYPLDITVSKTSYNVKFVYSGGNSIDVLIDGTKVYTYSLTGLTTTSGTRAAWICMNSYTYGQEYTSKWKYPVIK